MSVAFSVEDRVARVTLDRPDRMNAVDAETEAELEAIWSEIERRDDISCVVLTGAGEKAFCAGADLKGGSGSSGVDYWAVGRENGFGGLAFRRSLDVPVIARVNGYALGGGLEMALACDLRLIAVGAKVGLPEVTIGLVPGGGGTQRLPRLVGYQRAAEIVLTGRQLSADEAVACGMILRTVEPGDLLTQAEILARELAAKPGDALRCAKELLRRSQEVHVGLGTELEVDALLALLSKTARPSSQIHTRVEDALIATA